VGMLFEANRSCPRGEQHAKGARLGLSCEGSEYQYRRCVLLRGYLYVDAGGEVEKPCLVELLLEERRALYCDCFQQSMMVVICRLGHLLSSVCQNRARRWEMGRPAETTARTTFRVCHQG